MLGADYSTKLAPWMAAGCLSPRTIFHEVKKYEQQRTANKSTYWVIFELIWRDFFRWVQDSWSDALTAILVWYNVLQADCNQG